MYDYSQEDFKQSEFCTTFDFENYNSKLTYALIIIVHIILIVHYTCFMYSAGNVHELT